jgi:PilZ domain
MNEPNRVERRASQRFELHLPVVIEFEGATIHGFTQDLTGRGIFFYAEAAPTEGCAVQLTLTMPSEITLTESMRVRCRGQVLRVSPSNGKKNGIAVRLDSYQYLPSGASDSVVPLARTVRGIPA